VECSDALDNEKIEALFKEGGDCYKQTSCRINFEEIYSDVQGLTTQDGDNNCKDLRA
jgi:hypothetical protein